MKDRLSSRSFARPEFLVLLLALLVRLLGLFARPIWYDEAFAVLFAREGPAAMLYGTLAPDALGSAADIHPLGYYTLLWGWMKVFGQSVPAVRLLSVLLGLGVVWAGMRLLRALAGRRTAWWGGVFLALAPFPVHFSQEIRMYGLLAFLLLNAVFFMWRAAGWLQGESPASPRRDWAVFSVLAALAMYTHNLAAFFLVPLALLTLFRRDRAALRGVALAGAGALLLYLPWLLQLPGQLAKVQAAYWTARPGPDRLVTTLLTFTTNLPVPAELLPFAVLVAVLVPVIAARQTLRARDRLPGDLLAYLAFAPALLMFAVSQWVPVYIERALLPSGVFFVLWAAWALQGTPMPRPMRIGVSAVFLAGMLLGIWQHLAYRGFPYAPFAELNRQIAAEMAPDAAVVHASKLTALPAYLLAPDLPHRYLRDIPGSGSDTLALPTQEVIGFYADETVEEAVGASSEVWFIVFERELAEYEAAGVEIHPALEWLSDTYNVSYRETMDDLEIVIFQMQPSP